MTSQKILKSYYTGFIISLVLLLVSSWLVMAHVLSVTALPVVLFILVLLQLCTQTRFFMRMNVSAEDRSWNLMSFLFVILVVCVILGGTIWIMYNLHYNMVH